MPPSSVQRKASPAFDPVSAELLSPTTTISMPSSSRSASLSINGFVAAGTATFISNSPDSSDSSNLKTARPRAALEALPPGRSPSGMKSAVSDSRTGDLSWPDWPAAKGGLAISTTKAPTKVTNRSISASPARATHDSRLAGELKEWRSGTSWCAMHCDRISRTRNSQATSPRIVANWIRKPMARMGADGRPRNRIREGPDSRTSRSGQAPRRVCSPASPARG